MKRSVSIWKYELDLWRLGDNFWLFRLLTFKTTALKVCCIFAIASLVSSMTTIIPIIIAVRED